MESEFRAGAVVECTDGPAGKLERLVLDPGSEKVTHLVVESQPHFGILVLVPRERVAASDGDTVRLNCTREELKLMDPFEEVMYSPPTSQATAVESVPAPYSFPAPGLGVAPMTGIGGPFGVAPIAPPIVEEVVPEGEVVVGRDAVVQARDGDIGHVDDILADAATGRLTHLVVRSGHLWATHHFRIPASAIERVEEGNVRLRLTRQEVETIAREGESAATAPPPTVSSSPPIVRVTPAVPAPADTGDAPAPPSARIVRPPSAAGTPAGAPATTSQAPPRGPHLVGLFATREQAEDAIDSLIAGGFPSDALSAVTAEGRSVSFPTAGEERLDRGGRNTAIGAAVGAIAGFAIFGPLLVLVGAVAGGLVGLLTSLGATQEQAEYMSERVRSGHYLVVVGAGEREPEARSLLENAGASDVHAMSA